MGTQYGIVLKANQQVSKVEEEGDDDRDEGPAGTEQDEVGGKNLICKTKAKKIIKRLGQEQGDVDDDEPRTASGQHLRR